MTISRPVHRLPDHSAFAGAQRFAPAAFAAVAVTFVRWRQMGPLPTGLDGGEWLAIGRGLAGGHHRVTDGAYAPLIPLSMHGLTLMMAPTTAVLIIALGTFAAFMLSLVGVSIRTCGPWITAGLVLAASNATSVSEPLAFGGYPQQFAFAAVLAGLYGFSSAILTGSRPAWAISAGGFALAALSHHIFFPLGVCAAVAASLIWCVQAGTLHRRRRAMIALGSLAPGVALAIPTLIAFRSAAYAPPLDAAPFTLAEAWRYSTREAILLWTACTLVAPFALWMTRKEPSPAWYLASGLLAASGAGFLLSAEPRMVSPLVVSVLLAVALVLAQCRDPATRAIFFRIAAIGLLALVIWRGNGEAQAFFRFYRVLDRSTLLASRAIESANVPGAVAVRADSRGWPIGWWYEGLTTADVIVGSDPRWLGFPVERDAAATVAAIFDGTLTPSLLRNQAQATGISLLACRKWDWIGWERWLAAPRPAVEVVFDDDVTLVLRVIDPEPPEIAGV